MHRKLPPSRISWHAGRPPLPNPGTNQRANNLLKKDAVTTIAQEIDRVESKYWHNRIISRCRQEIDRIIHPPPSVKLNKLVNDLTKHSPNGDQQKVLVALKLHVGRAIKLHQSKDGTLAFTNGNIPISTKTMEAVVQSIKQTYVEVAYAYLRKGKQLPDGYLRQLILPHIIQKVHEALQYERVSKLPVTQQQLCGRHKFSATPEQYILDLLQTAGIKDEKSFTFERMLEFKKDLRNNIVPSKEEQHLLSKEEERLLSKEQHLLSKEEERLLSKEQHLLSKEEERLLSKEEEHLLSKEEQHLATRLQVSSPNNWTPTHQLTEPQKTNHFIEEDDIQHIRELVSEGALFSRVHFKDIGNRIKRTFLRNKRNQIIIFLALTTGAILAAIFPPVGMAIGIAITIELVTSISYIIFWSSSTALWRRIRMARGLRRIREYADFDYTNFDKTNDKKRKELIKNLRYRCKYKTFTQIYNAYAELEKQAAKIKELAKNNQKTLTESIVFEEEKALYHERRKKLESNLFFFDKLIENVVISKAIIDNRYIKDLESLWNEKFENMNPVTRQSLFRRVSRNKMLIIHSHQIKTTDPKWMHRIIPNWMNKSRNTIEPPDSKGTAIEGAKTPTVFKAAGVIKEMFHAFILTQIKGTIFDNLVNFFKGIGRNSRTIRLSPVAPKLTLDYVLVFVGIFFAERVADYENTKINQKRMERIVKKKPDYTRQFFGKRLRTGREEIGTLRSLSKSQVEPMVDHLINSIKSMEEIGSILDDAKNRSKMLGKGQFGSMSDEDAAIIILRHAAWQQLLDKEINSAFSNFYRIVREKASDWDSKVVQDLITKSQQSILVSKDDTAVSHMTNTAQDQGRGASQQVASGTVQQLQSEAFLLGIRNRPSGKLINKFRQREISEGKALQEIGALSSLDELLALQFWIEITMKEGSYHQYEDTLRKFHHFVSYIIDHKYHSIPLQGLDGSQRPIDPI